MIRFTAGGVEPRKKHGARRDFLRRPGPGRGIGSSWRRLIIGLVTAAAVTAVLLLRIPEHARWVSVVLNAGHGAIFFGLAVLGMWEVAANRTLRNWPVWWQYSAVLLAAAVLGGAIELLQIPLERDADLADEINDVLGALAGLALFATFDRRSTAHFRASLLVGGFLATLFIAAPVAKCAAAYLRREMAFPVIADFRHSLDEYFVVPQRVRVSRTLMDGEHALCLKFERGPWPGIAFTELVPDWNAHRYLVLDVINPDAVPVTLGVRIDDGHYAYTYEDRFNTTFTLQGHEHRQQRVSLEHVKAGPRDRALDLSLISYLLLYRRIGQQEVSGGATGFCVARVWLE